MSDSTWSQRFALGIVLVVFWALLLTYSTSGQNELAAPNSQNIEKSANQTTSKELRSGDAVEVLPRIRSAGAEICEEGADCTQKDLYQQWRSAEAIELANSIAFVQLGLAIVGTGLIVWGLFLNRDATRAATDAATTARMQFEEAERPMFFVRIANNLTPGSQPNVLDLSIIIQNVGTRPAFVDDVEFNLVITINGKEHVIANDWSGILREQPEEVLVHGELRKRIYYISESTIFRRLWLEERFSIRGIFTYEDPLNIKRRRKFEFYALCNGTQELPGSPPILWLRDGSKSGDERHKD